VCVYGTKSEKEEEKEEEREESTSSVSQVGQAVLSYNQPTKKKGQQPERRFRPALARSVSCRVVSCCVARRKLST